VRLWGAASVWRPADRAAGSGAPRGNGHGGVPRTYADYMSTAAPSRAAGGTNPAPGSGGPGRGNNPGPGGCNFIQGHSDSHSSHKWNGRAWAWSVSAPPRPRAATGIAIFDSWIHFVRPQLPSSCPASGEITEKRKGSEGV
jgi:hypothetical protein